MKTLKRTLALVLTVCMLLGMPLISNQANAAEVPDTLEVVRVEQSSATTLEVYFNASVYVGGTTAAPNGGGGIYAALRIVNGPANTQQNLINDTSNPAHGNLQWGGNLQYYTSTGALTKDPAAALPEEMHHMRWTMTGSKTINGVTVNTIDGFLALVEEGGYYADTGYAAMLCIEENGDLRQTGTGLLETVWINGTTGTKLTGTRTIRTSSNDGVYMPISPPTGVTLDNAYCYNDNRIILEFSEAVGNIADGRYVGVRIVDATNTVVRPDAGQPYYQWSLGSFNYYGTYNNSAYGNRLIGTLATVTINGQPINTLSGIMALAATNPAWSVKLCIEEGVSGTVNGRQVIWSSNRYVDNFYGLGESSMVVNSAGTAVGVSYTKHLFCNKNGRDGIYVDITSVTEDITVVSAEATGRNTINVTFSEGVTLEKYFDSTHKPTFNVSLVDAANNPIAGAVWSANAAPTASANVWTLTLDFSGALTLNCNSLYDILKLTESAAYTGARMAVGILQNPVSTIADISGYVDNVTSTDGVKMLKAGNAAGTAAYAVVTGVSSTEVTLESAELINDQQIKVTFSESVSFVGDTPWMSLRIVDENNFYLTDGAVLQWGGSYTWVAGSDQTQLIWTMQSNTKDAANIPDVIRLAGNYPAGTLKFGIEEKGAPGFTLSILNGVVDNVITSDFRCLKANTVGGNNGAYAPLTLGFDIAAITLDEVRQVNETQLLLTFSAPIQFEARSPFMAIRMINPVTGGIVRDGVGHTTGTHMQFSGSWKYYDSAQTQVLWTMGSPNSVYGIETLTQLFSFDTGKNLGQFANLDYVYQFCIEELDPQAGQTFPHFGGNKLISNITAKGDSPKMLQATKRASGFAANNYDSVYSDIVQMAAGEVTVTAAEATGPRSVKVTFSEAVSLTQYHATAKPTMFVQLVDGNNAAVAASTLDGTFVPGVDNTFWSFTITTNSVLGCNSLADLAALTQPGGAYEGYTVKIGIKQTLGADGDIAGYIDNVTSADGAKGLKANNPAGDVLYTGVTGIGTDEVTLVSAQLLNEQQLRVTFSEPIYFYGTTPYIGLRLLDAGEALVWSGGAENQGTPMQWSGSWEWTDETQTEMIWTMTSSAMGVYNLTDLLAFKGIESFANSGYTFKFGFEEKPGGDLTSVSTANGVVDNVKAADGHKSLTATYAVTNKYNGAYVSLTADFDVTPVTIVSAKQVSASQLLITFSEPIVIQPGTAPSKAAWMSIRMVNPTTNTYINDGGVMQWGGTWSYYDEAHTQILWTKSASGIKNAVTIDDLLSYKGELAIHNGTYPMRFSIEEVAVTGAPYYFRSQDMRVANVTSVDLKKGLTANRNGANAGYPDGVYVDITPTADPITVVSAVATGSKTVEITFSEDVTTTQYSSVVSPGASVRLVDADNKPISGAEWTGTFASTADADVWTFIITGRALGCNSLADILSLTQAGGLHEGAALKLVITQSLRSGSADITGYIENFTSLDGEKRLVSNRADWDNNCTEITGISLTEVTLVSTELVNDQQILVTFSEPVEFIGNANPWMSLRLVDENNVYITDGTEAAVVMQWSGSWAWVDGTDQQQLLWTLTVGNNTAYPAYSITDLLNYVGIEAFSDYALKFGIEENGAGEYAPNMQNGIVDNIVSVSDGKSLTSNCLVANRRDGAYSLISADFDTSLITLESVEQYNETQLLITFSRSVDIVGRPFMGIRMMTVENNLLQDENGTYMQWGGTWSWVEDSNQTQILWKIGPNNTYGVGNLTDVFSYSADKGLDAFTDYALQFCIEELPPDAARDEDFRFVNRDRLISNITGIDSPKMMSATKVGGYDGAYIDIDLMDYDPTPVTFKSAEILSDTQLLITFSESVEFLDTPYIGVRMVNENGHLMWSEGAENQGTPLQWGGTWAWVEDSNQTQMIWTKNAGGAMGVRTLVDIVNFNGDLARFKDEGTITFAFEEKPGDNSAIFLGNGLVDNIVAADRYKTLSATLTRGGSYYDGAYVKLTGTLAATQPEIRSVEVVSDLDVIITFNAPVTIIGNANGEGGRPWISLRMVDENNALVSYLNENDTRVYMQWGGSWDFVEGSNNTQIKWTMTGTTHNIGNFTDILNYKNLEDFTDYTFKFAIEELGDQVLNRNGMIENIRLAADSKVHLVANKVGYYDGIYLDFELVYTALDTTFSAKVLNDTQVLLTFNQPISISSESNPYIAIRYTKNGELLWSGEKDKSVPIQWGGTFEFVKGSRTQILWTMNGGGTLGANNVYDVLNFKGACAQFKGATISVCVEENGAAAKPRNGLVDNIIVGNGENHMRGTYGTHFDGVYATLRSELDDDLLEVIKVQAIDDMTLEITFSRPAQISDGDDAPSIAIRYMNEVGDTDVVVDGRLAIFQGTWAWKDAEQTVMVWTLDTERARGANNLTEIFAFQENFVYNNSSNYYFCILEPENEELPGAWNYRIDGITTPDAMHKLCATELSQFGRGIYDIEVLFELPDTPIGTGPEEIVKIIEVTNYWWVYVLAGLLVVCGMAVGLALGKKRRERGMK